MSSGSAGGRRAIAAFTVACAIALGNLALWRTTSEPAAAPDHAGQIAGLAYNAFQRWDSPLERKFPRPDQVDDDLALLSKMTGRVRTYSASELPELPLLAASHDLRVTAGVWLDGDRAADRREMEAIKQAVRGTDAIERVIAGNEVLLRGSLTPGQLMAHLDELRDALRVPVSTAEPWHVWLKHPELARHVDYITVHLLPYWEGVPAERAVDYAMWRLDQIHRTFPGKHVVIGEIGWPSRGDRYDGAQASNEIQARFIRDFLVRAAPRKLDYFLMEAIDQPWKAANEGRAGAHWGILTADRTAKFALVGPLGTDSDRMAPAVVASIAGFFAMLWFGLTFARLRLSSRLVFCALIQGTATLLAWMLLQPFEDYLRPVDWAALGLLLPGLMIAALILLAHGFEFAEMFWRGNLARAFGTRPVPPGAREPFVSIHLACCNEPPEMVIATLDSLAALDWSRYEVVVVDNNTRDEALWRPVERRCAELGTRFRFFHLPAWPGFKAGALNFALEKTDPRAEVIAVVDADYVVKRGWLRALTGWFEDAKVGVVQSPQAHREWQPQPLKRAMNWEYDGFFRIGMHHRNERDAIIQHGTMTMIRAQALRQADGWAEWCICEDAELGLRLMKAGWSTVYVDQVMGEGLVPDDFTAFCKQRRRWAFGAMQILKAHARSLFRGGKLTAAQRYHFVSGWVAWFGDALHLVFALAAMAWTVGVLVAPAAFPLPIAAFAPPLLALFACRAILGPLLYLRRVPCSLPEAMLAALASAGLSHAVARGVFSGLRQRAGVFEVTRKGAAAKARAGLLTPIREEVAMLAGLGACMLGIWLTRRTGHHESALWLTLLAMQAVPYAAALVCTLLSRWPAAQPSALPGDATAASMPSVLPVLGEAPAGHGLPVSHAMPVHGMANPIAAGHGLGGHGMGGHAVGAAAVEPMNEAAIEAR